MENPTFSIVMPAYNAASTIKGSIDSVLAQVYTDYELIAVNDCSKDNTLQILRDYAEQDSRIRVINLENNSGVAVARNAAIEMAAGRYIAFLDSDDLWEPRKLAVQLETLNSGADVVYAMYTRFYPDGKQSQVNVPEVGDYKKLLTGNFIGNLTGVYDQEKLGKIFQKKVHHEDYLMWLEILEKTDYALGIQENLAYYRVGEDSLSANKIQSAKWTWDIYRKYCGLNLFSSMYFFSLYVLNSIIKRM
ncbi:glycosyltransferase family 2 protein [Paenalcaligenes sp. Me52]|uniref:glycosyltransferase family 2 protein n=1 Tax=Paenalcaligenes sp. Me52 TaxID=3392038 RepID=UPI003D269C61